MKHTPTPRRRLARSGALAALCLVAAVGAAAPPRTPQTMITPNYKDADLGQIVEAVSQVTGKNFIIDPRVKAQVTMLSATPMTPDAFYEAFLAILQVHGFVAVQSGQVYKIIPDANARTVPANDLPDRVSSISDEVVTQVVALRNVSAAQLVPILRPLIPQYGHLAAYPAANILIISDRANNVSRMLKIIDRIDRSADDEIEVLRLENASATEVVRVVNQLSQAVGAEAGATAKLIADERTNSVLLSGERNQRLRLRALVAHLDTPLEKGGGTVVRYLHYADAEKLAQKLKEQVQAATQASAGAAGAAAGGAQAAQERSTTIWADVPTNALVITAPPKLMRQLMDVVDRLDIRRLEVQVETIIVEFSANKSIDFGVNWAVDGSNSGKIGTAVYNQPIGDQGTTIAGIASAVIGAGQGGAITGANVPNGLTYAVGRIAKTGTNFAAILNALAGDASTNIIGTPTIVTLDNQEATIKIANEVPFLTGQYSTSATTVTPPTTGGTTTGLVNPFQTIQRQEVGTILKLTPQITDDGNVLLKIDQEVSALIKSAIQTVDVQTSKRTITTRVLANDGEIIVLGGLIQDEVTETENRVPILGSIPVLGYLFKTKSSTKTKTNLMVFMRPKILVTPEQMATETAAKYNYFRGLQTGGNPNVALMPGEPKPSLPELKSLQPTTVPAETPKSKASHAPSPGQQPPPGTQAPPAPPPAAPPPPPPSAGGPGR
jgi:general secretion pathway protein D